MRGRSGLNPVFVARMIPKTASKKLDLEIQILTSGVISGYERIDPGRESLCTCFRFCMPSPASTGPNSSYQSEDLTRLLPCEGYIPQSQQGSKTPTLYPLPFISMVGFTQSVWQMSSRMDVASMRKRQGYKSIFRTTVWPKVDLSSSTR